MNPLAAIRPPAALRYAAALHCAAVLLVALHSALPVSALAQARVHHENLGGAAPTKGTLAQGHEGRPSHIVNEGGVERQLWIDTGRVAEFDQGGGPPKIRAAGPGELGAGDRAAGPDAKSDAKSGAATQPAAASATGVPDATGVADPAAKPVSPVFVDASGRPRALPGGLIVSLKQGLPEAGAREELAAAGLSPVRQIGERMWLVESPAGLASLELANRLQAEGRFEFVQPNWWQPKTTK